MLIGLPGKMIEPAIGNVSFDLLIPRVRNEILEPLGKSSQVRLRQPRDFRLQFLNAHGGNLIRHTPGSKPATTPKSPPRKTHLTAKYAKHAKNSRLWLSRGIRGRGGAELGIELGLTLNCRGARVSNLGMARKTSKMGGFTVVEILIVVVLLILLVLVAMPDFVNRGYRTHAQMCISNLRIIDAAKSQWALETHKQKTDIPTGSDIQPFLGLGSSGELPCCPNDSSQTLDTSYLLHDVGTKPTCKIYPTNHVLP